MNPSPVENHERDSSLEVGVRYFEPFVEGRHPSTLSSAEALEAAATAMNEWLAVHRVDLVNVESVWGRGSGHQQPYDGEEPKLAGLRLWYSVRSWK
jgi:hypothetical protein